MLKVNAGIYIEVYAERKHASLVSTSLTYLLLFEYITLFMHAPYLKTLIALDESV